MKPFLIVALGSGIGGMLRYGLQALIYKLYPSVFPLGTFLVNLLGCFLIGVFIAMGEKESLSAVSFRLFLITGLCGGFTTFSTFSIDNVILLKSGHYLTFLLYAGGSVAFGILFTIIGIAVVKAI